MDTFSPVERLFKVFDETANILQEALSCTYLEALGETAENMFHNDVLQEEVNEIAKKRLKKQYDEVNLNSTDKETVRKAYQLAILKGMKENTQPNHQMTPDSIGLFISYLLGKFMNQTHSYSILDPALGTGNLLLTVLNQQSGKELHALGVEIDDVLIKLAYAGANLMEQPISLYNQDALEPLFIDPVDAVVCDLPVGYYPNDERSKEYKLKADEGHSYAHHLFIEQSLRHTAPGGYLFFLIPNALFESPESRKLHEFLQNEAHIQSVIQLPLSMFKNKQAAKSILVLQKKGEDIQPPKQILLANLPSLTNPQSVQGVLTKLDKWFQENK
ncbi:MAG TPA: class I SAM-dependent methyltransferase [Chondromyces sp.]|nr:class I SAM-dependent methyltransferase [Chondromyces sp.]